MTDLNPCPFCGSYHVRACTIPTGYKLNPRVWYVKCDDCESKGTKVFDKAEAIAAWNARAERACKFVTSKGSDYPPVCSACGYELGIYDCAWYEDGTYGYERNYCPNCGAKVVDE